MPSYIAFIQGKLRSSESNSKEDGKNLANQCIASLAELNESDHFFGHSDQFPPKLLILLASPSYLQQTDAQNLARGVQETFLERCKKKIPLVGTSVSAVFFDGEIYENGALLICLASRFITAKVGAGPNVRDNYKESIDNLLKDLDVNITEDVNPKSNRLFLTFFPVFRESGSPLQSYPSDELHDYLGRTVMHRIPIAGGVSASTPEAFAEGLFGFQISDDPSYGISDSLVHRDAIVAALIETGVPLGGSFCRGLRKAQSKRFRVKRISDDGREIIEFEEGKLADVLGSESDYLLFSDGSEERDLIVGISEPSTQRTVKVVDHVNVGDTLSVLNPQPQMMLQMAQTLVDRSLKRIRIENPLASLVFVCSAHYRKRGTLGLDVGRAIKLIERKFVKPCVGGFLDGEAGVDHTGRSQFGNWSMVGLYFGDELRDRTPLYYGFKALADYDQKIIAASSLRAVIDDSLDLAFNTGFPGAMLSLPQREHRQTFLVGKSALGRLAAFCDRTFSPVDDYNVLALTARTKTSLFIPDSREHLNFDRGTAKKVGLISQYIIPLQNSRKEIIGVLQIDLGDASKKQTLHEIEKEVMDSIGATISAGLSRILDMEEVRIGRELDQALKTSLSEDSIKEGLQGFIEKAVQIFRVNMGHIRLEKNVFVNNRSESLLELVAGTGEYYENAIMERSDINSKDNSPTAEVFATGETIIINDAKNNASHRAMCERQSKDCPATSEVLARLGSYASTPLKNQKGETIGTINLVSDETWFFTSMHENALQALGERAGFLVEHLQQKEKSAENLNRITFLHSVSPSLEGIQNFANLHPVLKNVTKVFSKAAKAQRAALFLWEKEIQKFVLRGQFGWHTEDGMIGAAKYEKREGWIGEAALKDALTTSRYTPGDENASDFLNPAGPYAEQMFGKPMAAAGPFDAIALPLQGPKRLLGMLVLYRDIVEGEPRSSISIKDSDLTEGSERLAALIALLLSSRANLRYSSVQEQSKKIYDALFFEPSSMEDLERNICSYLAAFSRARKVALYRISGTPPAVELVTEYTDAPDSSSPDERIAKFLIDGAPVIERYRIGQLAKIHESVLEGAIVRVCVPLVFKHTVTAVLDFHWTPPGPSPDDLFIFHNSETLSALGRMIGSAYVRYRLTFEREEALRLAERGDSVIKAMAGLIVQSMHSFGNCLRNLKAMPRTIGRAPADRRGVELEKLALMIRDGNSMWERPLQVAGRIIESQPLRWKLVDLVDRSIRRLRKLPETNMDSIKLENAITNDCVVFVDQGCVEEAFINIIHNAYKALQRKGDSLAITATSDEDADMVTIVFEDNGPGMTQEEIDKAKRGFFHPTRLKGVGVLIALTLIRSQGGSLDIISEYDHWTRVLVNLPRHPERS